MTVKRWGADFAFDRKNLKHDGVLFLKIPKNK